MQDNAIDSEVQSKRSHTTFDISAQSNGFHSVTNSTNVLIAPSTKGNWDKFKDIVIPIITNKANISNFLTFLLMIAGIVLVHVYDNKSDEDKYKAWVMGFKLLRAFGLFGFGGGITNWLAIRMLFEKIPFIFGSGILLRHFIEIRENVKKTTMETYFDAGHLSVYVTQKTEIILGALQLDECIKETIRSPKVQQLIDEKVDEVFQTPEGLVLGVMVDKDRVKEAVIPSLENVGEDIVPIVSDLVRNNENLTEENLRAQVDKLISSNIVEMEPNYVVGVVKRMVANELVWVIIWGNIFGGILGVALELVVVLKD